MALWAEDETGNYINLDHFFKVTANDEGGGTIRLYALLADETTTTSEDYIKLAGTWSTLPDAREAFRRLARAEDPSTYGDLD